MGDRTNTVFRMADGSQVVLYQHWGGDQMMNRLATALNAASGRWTDEAYCTRIVISQLIGERWNQEFSFGISTYIMDNEHSIPVIDFSDNTVALYGYGSDPEHGGYMLKEQKFRMDFDSFVKKFMKVSANDTLNTLNGVATNALNDFATRFARSLTKR